MNRKTEKEEKNDRRKWFVLLLLLILLLFTILICILFSQRGKHGANNVDSTDSDGNVSGGVELVIDPNAENNPPYENDNTAEQGVAISGRGAITIPANKKEVAVDFYNPTENEGLYYLAFELRLSDEDGQGYEVLYTSGLVEPGKHINWIELSRGLKKGVYEAVVHVQPYRMNEEKTLTNNADMKIALIVQ